MLLFYSFRILGRNRKIQFYFISLFRMMFSTRESDEHSRKQSKYISLHESHEDFDEVHEEQHDTAEDVKSDTIRCSHRPSEEDDTCERENNRVTSHDIGKETDHQCERLSKYTYELNDRN